MNESEEKVFSMMTNNYDNVEILNESVKLLLSMLDNNYKSYSLLNDLYEVLDKFYLLGEIDTCLLDELIKILSTLKVCLQNFNDISDMVDYYERVYEL